MQWKTSKWLFNLLRKLDVYYKWWDLPRILSNSVALNHTWLFKDVAHDELVLTQFSSLENFKNNWKDFKTLVWNSQAIVKSKIDKHSRFILPFCRADHIFNIRKLVSCPAPFTSIPQLDVYSPLRDNCLAGAILQLIAKSPFQSKRFSTLNNTDDIECNVSGNVSHTYHISYSVRRARGCFQHEARIRDVVQSCWSSINGWILVLHNSIAYRIHQTSIKWCTIFSCISTSNQLHFIFNSFGKSRWKHKPPLQGCESKLHECLCVISVPLLFFPLLLQPACYCCCCYSCQLLSSCYSFASNYHRPPPPAPSSFDPCQPQPLPCSTHTHTHI